MIKKQTKRWKMSNGETIRICDMSPKHLDNTINYLAKCAEYYEKEAIVYGQKVLEDIKAETASICLEDYLYRLEEEGIYPAEIFPIYENLVTEKERRELLNLEKRDEQSNMSNEQL